MLNGWKWSCRKCESNVGCARHFRWRSRQIKAISLTLFHCYSVLLMQFESFNWQITKESTGFHSAMTLLIVLLLIQLQGLLKAKKKTMTWHDMKWRCVQSTINVKRMKAGLVDVVDVAISVLDSNKKLSDFSRESYFFSCVFNWKRKVYFEIHWTHHRRAFICIAPRITVGWRLHCVYVCLCALQAETVRRRI